MAKFNPTTATVQELNDRIARYTEMARVMTEQDCDSPQERKQIENLRRCAAGLRAELARRELATRTAEQDALMDRA